MLNHKSSRCLKACVMMLLSSVVACTSSTTTATNASVEPVPAVLLESSAHNTQQLQQAMSKALKGVNVTLVSDAFLQQNQHVLEKQSFNKGMPNLDGLMLEIPQSHRFAMFKKGTQCYLRYLNTGENYPLAGLRCKALKQ